MVGFEDIIGGLRNQIAAFSANTPVAGGFQPGGTGGGGFNVQPVQATQWQVGGAGQQPGFAIGPVGGNGFQVGGPNGTGFGVGGVRSAGFDVGHYSPPQAPAPASAPDDGSASGTTSTGFKPGVAKWADQARATFGQYADVMLAIMTNESGGDPGAYNGAGDAWGLFQQVGLNSKDPQVQFQAAKKLLDDKLRGIQDAYAKNGLNPDDRTRARDIALAWAGHFDYGTGGPNPASRDIGSGQTADQLAAIFLANYDAIRNGRAAGTPTGGGSGDLASIKAPWAQKAQQYLGIPYTNGGIRQTGDPRSGMDCSSFTGYVMGLPSNLWNAQAQADASQKISLAQAQPGDLVFFQGTTTGDPSARPVTHVGIYIGGGRMVHTGGDGGVMVVDLNTPYWQQHYYSAGRITR